ncbi:hypothetical protein HY346_00250 [Candidatus Microgenomates bacterium]|nr:hypothetical protein [Candidatus Microgenomates bacterium]
MVFKGLKQVIAAIRPNRISGAAMIDALIDQEAQIGGSLFGPPSDGQTRRFYCADESTWVWEESIHDQQGQTQQTITEYRLEAGQIVKYQNRIKQLLTTAELKNLLLAMHWYALLVARRVYGQKI